MDAWEVGTISAIVSAMVTLVIQPLLKYLFKYSIRHEYDAKLEEVKGRIKGESDAATASLKAEHEKLLTDHKIRFSVLHAEQAKTIGDVHGALLQAEENLGDAFNPGRSVDKQKAAEKLHKAKESYEQFSRLAMKSRIYFSTALCERFDDLRKVAKDAYMTFTTWIPIPEEQREDKDKIADRQNQHAAYEAITGKFALMRELLEEDFRAILGSDGGKE